MMSFSLKQSANKRTLQQFLASYSVIAVLQSTVPATTFALRYFQRETVGLISKEGTFLPYLSLVDNLFLASSVKDRDRRLHVWELFPLVSLDESLLSKKDAELTPSQRIKCQLIQLTVSSKKIIVLDNIFTQLQIKEKQELLPLIPLLAKRYQKQFIFFTDESKIANSPYVDYQLTDSFLREFNPVS